MNPFALAAAVVVGCVGVAGGVVAVGSSGGLTWGAAPLLGLCAGLAFAVQWIAWIPASIARSERFYDLCGSATYLSVVGLALLAGGAQRPIEPRHGLLAGLVAVWAVRLGTFLFARIRREGKDGRFDALKQHPARFLVPWTVQGLWVFLTALAALIVLTRAEPGGALGPSDVVGGALWALGFGVEVAADRQKAAFRARPGSAGRWIDEGLWSLARHPNYFGEILLWTGIAVVGAGVFHGGQWIGLISPVFVAILLLAVSGVPLLDARAIERWGDDPDYRAYRARTRELLPLPRIEPGRGRDRNEGDRR